MRVASAGAVRGGVPACALPVHRIHSVCEPDPALRVHLGLSPAWSLLPPPAVCARGAGLAASCSPVCPQAVEVASGPQVSALKAMARQPGLPQSVDKGTLFMRWDSYTSWHQPRMLSQRGPCTPQGQACRQICASVLCHRD